MQVKTLWYIDETYLDNLLEQIIVQKGTLNEVNNKLSEYEIEAGVSIPNLLKKIGFPINLSINHRYNIRKEAIKEKGINESTIKKLDYIGEQFKQIRDLKDVLEEQKDNRKIILTKGEFSLQEIYYNGKKSENLIKKVNFVEDISELTWHFEYFMKVDNSQNQFGNGQMVEKLMVNMLLDGAKIKRGLRHIVTKIEKYHNFDFIILGELEKIDLFEYYLKPIAIYQESDMLFD